MHRSKHDVCRIICFYLYLYTCVLLLLNAPCLIPIEPERRLAAQSGLFFLVPVTFQHSFRVNPVILIILIILKFHVSQFPYKSAERDGSSYIISVLQ